VSGEASQKGKAAKRQERVERGIYRRVGKKGVVYEYTFVDTDGKQRWGHCDRLQEARDERATKLAAVKRGERAAPSKASIAEVAETWYSQKQPRLRKRTADAYRRSLDLVVLPRFGRWKLQEVDADAIVRLIRDLEREGLHALHSSVKKRPLGASAIENYLKPLQGTLAFAVRRGMIAQSPFTVLTDDDRPVPAQKRKAHKWTDKQVEALLAASEKLAGERKGRYDFTPILSLMAALGLRIGEALGLQWRDLERDDDGNSVLHVQRSLSQQGVYGPTKTEAGDRKIPLPAGLRDELIAARLRSRFSKETDPIFASLTGTPLSYRNFLRRGWDASRDAAKLPESLTPHELRHAAASRLIHAGLDPVSVAAVLGHEDANITLRIYGHVYEELRTADTVREAIAGGRSSS
jgi:integrase